MKTISYWRALRPADSTKLTPQACQIVHVLNTHGAPMTRKELVDALSRRLVSNQSPTRVVAFYKKILLATGFVAIEKRQEASATVQL